MGTQGAIIESLRMKREGTVDTDKMNRQLRQAISERKMSVFIKNRNSSYKVATSTVYERTKNLGIRQSDARNTDEILEEAAMIYSNGDRYVGGFRDGLPDGFGTIVSKNLDMFVGEWKKGMQHGRGTYIWPDDCIFIGTWKNGNKHGKGAYYENGELYDGEWENGKLISTEGLICDKAAKR